MVNVKKYFLEGMDADSAPKLIGAKSYLNLMNASVGVSEFGRNLRVENRAGQMRISQSVYPPYGNSQTIGSCVDEKRGYIIYANYNTFDDHGFYAHDVATGTTYAILYDSQVIGGLNLSKTSRIDRNMRVVGDLVYWTDNKNEPRRINYIAGIKMNHASFVTSVLPYSYPMNPEVITVIRRPPFYPPDSTKSTDGAFVNNFIANDAFQFCVRYFYRDYETSVFGDWCELSPYNSKDDTYNYIEVKMPLTEIIEQDVLEAELIVRFGNYGKAFIIHTWTKTDINAHNAGTQLSYNFYNDTTGIPVDDATQNKPFDSVPLDATTLETAKDRLFLGNYRKGYSTPTTTSLSATIVTATNGSDVSGIWQVMTIEYYNSSTHTTTDIDYYVLLRGGGSPSLYFWGSAGGAAQPPSAPSATLSSVTAQYTTSSVHSMASWIAAQSGIAFTSINFSLDPYAPTTSCTLSGGSVSLAGSRAFKSSSTYRYAIWFFDKYRRRCGVVIPSSNTIETPERTYAQSVFNVGIKWSLSNTNAVNEIPNWAYYYVVGRTRNLTTSSFEEARVSNIVYVSKSANGTYDYTSTTYDVTRYGIAIDITSLISFGLGYVFSEGDLVSLYFLSGGGRHELPILEQDGQWLILKLKDLGSFGSGIKPLFEIDSPYKQQVSEFYYEVGNIYNVVNPTTNSRTYSVVNDTMNGDSYLLDRVDASSYFVEAMSPNDKFWQNWYSDIGWSNIADKIGQQRKVSSVSWSNTLIEGTRTNGLSSFDALDERGLPQECGSIQKLQNTSKIGEAGTVMLAICYNETVSLYLSETQLVAAAKNADIATSEGVIGSQNILKGLRGTQHPSTVVEYNGLVFWGDVNAGEWVQYATNGESTISLYKMSRFFKRYCKDYLAANSNNLDNINGFHHLATGIDPFNKELLVGCVGLTYENYASVLPSYGVVPPYATSIANRFDIYDELAKTMSFKWEENKWGSNYSYVFEQMEQVENRAFGWKNGDLFELNSDTTHWNRFVNSAGVLTDQPIRLCFVANELPSALKNGMDISVEGSNQNAPNFTVLLTDSPYAQITDLSDAEWTLKEGVNFATFFRDRTSPNSSGTPEQRLYTGDVMLGNPLYCMIEIQSFSQLVWVDAVNVGILVSKGMKQIAEK